MKKINDILRNLLARQSFKNTFWNLFSTVVYPLFLLGTTPLFIDHLGVEQFGLWMLVSTISQSMSIVNMGLGDANIKYISGYYAHQELNEIRNVVSTTFGLSLLIMALVIAGGFVFSWLVEINHWFTISDANRDIMGTCIELAVVLFSLRFLEIVLLSVFQGFERYDLQSKLALLSKTAIMVANVVWVLAGYDLVMILVSSIVTQVLFLVIEMILIKKQYPFVSLTPRYVKEDIRLVFSFSLWTWLQSVLAIISVSVDKFIVAWFSGVQTLSYYSLGYTVMTQVHAVFSASVGWVFPVVSRKRSQGESVADYFMNMQGILVSVGFVAIIVFLFLDKFLISIWLGAETTEHAYTFIHLFVYSNLFFLLNIIPHHFLNGSGFVKQNTYAELTIKGLMIIGMIAGYYLIGDVGLIWGIVISLALTSPLKTILLARFDLIEDNGLYWIQPLMAGGMAISFLEIDNNILRILFVLCFVPVFFYSYVKPAKLIMQFITGKKTGDIRS